MYLNGELLWKLVVSSSSCMYAAEPHTSHSFGPSATAAANALSFLSSVFYIILIQSRTARLCVLP